MGHTGNLNGEDIINIVCDQPATARFIARHLYNFFVADEPQVPAWSVTPPNDPEAIDLLAQTFLDSKADIKSILRVLFKSDFFKNARFSKVKSPAEIVVSTYRLVGGFEFPAPGIGEMCRQPMYMGQDLMNPPSVESWHTGVEWINSGTLMKRINFTAGMLGDTSRPGVQAIVSRLEGQGELAPESFVDNCLDILGPLEIGSETRAQLVSHANEGGSLSWGNRDASAQRVGEMLQLIASSREFQYC